MNQSQSQSQGEAQDHTLTLGTVMDDGGIGSRKIARVYALSLLNLAEKRGQADAIYAELSGIILEVFQPHPNIEKLLSSKAILRTKKVPIIDSAFGGRVSDLMLDFLRILNLRDRLELLRSIAVLYRELLDERAKRVRVKVKSAVALTEEQQEQLRSTLAAGMDNHPVLELTVDESLLGGLIVQVGDELFDGSVRTRLDTIRNQLLARSSYEIQVGRDRFSN